MPHPFASTSPFPATGFQQGKDQAQRRRRTFSEVCFSAHAELVRDGGAFRVLDAFLSWSAQPNAYAPRGKGARGAAWESLRKKDARCAPRLWYIYH
jgi:hypothetical protein